MILEEIEGEVVICDIAKNIQEVVSLKKEGPAFFRNAITFIYWMYNEESIYREMLHSQRKTYICKRHLAGEDPEIYENNVCVKKFINLYEEIQCSREERLRRAVQVDMDDLLNRLSTIKFTKKVQVSVTVEEKGEDVVKKIFVEIDNSKEKADAMALSLTLINLSRQLELKVKETAKTKKQDQSRRMFDRIPKKK